MPNATVRAKAQATPIDRRAALGSLAAAGALLAVPKLARVAMPGADRFDAAAWVRMFEDCGNGVYFDTNRSGQEMIGVYCPEGSVWPEWTEIRHWSAIGANIPEWRERVIAFLKSRGQRAGYPPAMEA